MFSACILSQFFFHQTNPVYNLSRKNEIKIRVVTTYALVALAPSMAFTIIKSSSFICAMMVLGAKTPAAKSAPPNSVPAAYSETSDGICLSFVCDCFERYDRQRSVPRCVSRGGMKEMVPRVQRGGQRKLRFGG